MYNLGRGARRRSPNIGRCGKLSTAGLENLLLFCVESAAGARVAYFAELDTLKDDVPELHRYACPRALFGSLILGGLYSVRFSGKRMTRADLSGEYDIDDGYFTLLLELKSIRYRLTERLEPFDPSVYYSFSELRSLLEYGESVSFRLVNLLISALLYIPALFAPPVLYMLLISALLPASDSAGVSLLAALSLPAMVFLMALGYQLCQHLLLKMERTRYGILRAYTLRHGGARLALTMSKDVKKGLAVMGAVSGGALLLGLILRFLL